MRLLLLLFIFLSALEQAQGIPNGNHSAIPHSSKTGFVQILFLNSPNPSNLVIAQDVVGLSQASVEASIKYLTAEKEQENLHLKAERKKLDLAIRHQKVVLALGSAVLFLLLVLLAVLYLSRQRGRKAYLALKATHLLMKEQQAEIIRQKDELLEQAAVLRAQNKQLEQHKHFRTKIFSIISHDLRTPFNSLKSVLGLVLRKKMTESQMQQVFGLLARDVETAADMLQNLLVWSGAQLEEAHVRLEPVDMHHLVKESMSFAAVQAEVKSIRLISSVGENSVVLGDKERLRFVLRNLLMNAVKFTYEGGLIEVQASVQENSVTVAVHDNGKGVPSKHIPKLFTENRFTTPGTLNEKGTGLGLMLSREFIESQNGSICAESEEGKGSVFSITLQRASFYSSHIKDVYLQPAAAI